MSWKSLRRTFTGALAAAVLAGTPAVVRAETLTDALILAFKNSHLLEQNRALLRAADEDVAQAISAIRPTINFVAGSTFTHRHNVGSALLSTANLTFDITLFDFGANQLAIDATKETVLATREALLQLEQQVLLTAVDAYMNVIRAFEFVQLRQSNVRLITQELRAARDRFEVGEVTRTDVSIAEARLAAARALLAAAEGDLEVARENYNASIGKYPGQLRRPPAPPMTARTEDAAKQIAMHEHPSIREQQRLVTVAELSIARAQTAMKPRVTGNITSGVSSATSYTSTVGVRLTAPIYAGGRLSSLKRQAIARRDAQRAALLQVSLTVKQNVGTAWARLAVASASIEASDRQVRAAQVAYNGVREEARLGARTTLAVLDAEQELLDARTSRVSAEIDRYVAVYALLAAMGLLTVDHLNLGIVTYDPAAYYNAVRDAPVRHVSPQGERLDRVLRSLGRN